MLAQKWYHCMAYNKLSHLMVVAVIPLDPLNGHEQIGVRSTGQ